MNTRSFLKLLSLSPLGFLFPKKRMLFCIEWDNHLAGVDPAFAPDQVDFVRFKATRRTWGVAEATTEGWRFSNKAPTDQLQEFRIRKDQVGKVGNTAVAIAIQHDTKGPSVEGWVGKFVFFEEGSEPPIGGPLPKSYLGFLRGGIPVTERDSFELSHT